MAKTRPTERHPVVTGVVALVAVGLVVGLVLGTVAWAGARFAGLDESASAGEDPSTEGDGDRLVLPRPKETEGGDGPLITLAPQPGQGGGGGGGEGGGRGGEDREDRGKRKKQQDEGITLSAGQNAVGVFDQIDLTGVYPGGEGRVLQVERMEGGTWVEFNATVAVSNETFSTFVQSGQAGPNRFRVVDSSDATTSNPVTVRVG